MNEIKRTKNGLGTAGFILALIGLFTGWIPIVGWIVWILGIVFCVIGLFKRPKGLAIAGTIISVVGIIILIILTNIGANALDSATEKVDSDSNKTSVSSSGDSKSKDKTLEKTYGVGDTVSYNGYELKVNTVNYSKGSEIDTPDSGKQYIIINLTITNNTDESQSYNPYDFKLNDDGNKTDLDELLVEDDIEILNSGDLDPGASVTGNLIGQSKTDSKSLKLQYQTSYWGDETVDINLK
ncbi:MULTISPECIES: DUF4352 domain-containing protein [Listeria]|uniref:DUF4352 domain-containing protein n=1 Tax=Listeria TaxID=1637 RepID=UPI001ABF2BD6|nr:MULTISPECIES: DUF4352 domain-containing protein [Listeria]